MVFSLFISPKYLTRTSRNRLPQKHQDTKGNLWLKSFFESLCLGGDPPEADFIKCKEITIKTLIPKFIGVQTPIHQIAQNMPDRNMAFLNSGRDIRGDGKNQINASGQLPGPAGHTDG